MARFPKRHTKEYWQKTIYQQMQKIAEAYKEFEPIFHLYPDNATFLRLNCSAYIARIQKAQKDLIALAD